MSLLKKFNVNVSGDGPQTIVFSHGFGCDQNMWRYMVPEFEKNYKVVLFDHIGCGRSDSSDYNHLRYNNLEAYSDDVLKIAGELNLKDAIFVGHSVSAMIGVLADKKDSSVFDRLVLVCPSPRYINDTDYIGGFEKEDIEGLLEALENNYLGWSHQMAPVIMANEDKPELGEELANSFCQMSPEIAKNFAHATFYSDNREDLKNIKTKSLVIQCSEDALAPLEVGEYVHKNLSHSEFVLLEATGHCPNLSAPQETTAAIKAFLGQSS